MTVRASGTALSQLALDLERDYGFVVWVPDSLAGKQVEAWFDGPLTSLLDVVANQVDAHWRWSGDRFVFQPGPPFLLYLPENNRPDDVAGLISTHFDVEATTIGPQVLITGPDTPAAAHVIQRLGGTPGRYIVDVLVIELQSSLARELGLGWSLGGAAGFGVSGGSDVPSVSRWSAEAVVDVVGRVAATSDRAKLSNRANLFLVEGELASATQGDRIPLPRRSVSAEGVVTIVGYEYVQSGFQLEARAVSLPDSSIRLDLQPTLSEVGGLIAGENPVLLERSLTASVVVRSNEWVLIGGFDRMAERASAQGVLTSTPLGSLQNRSVDTAVTLLAVRVRRL